jgi:hypothetical protein
MKQIFITLAILLATAITAFAENIVYLKNGNSVRDEITNQSCSAVALLQQAPTKKEMKYFKKVMKSNKYKTQKKYTGLIKNEALLCNIAIEKSALRELASERIYKEDLLYKVAEKSFFEKDYQSYQKIIPEITDQKLLCQLIKLIKNSDITYMGESTVEILMGRISDIEMIKDLAKTSTTLTTVRLMALKRINDQTFLYEFAITDGNDHHLIDSVILNKLNEEMLQKIVMNKTGNYTTRSSAISKITDQQFLYKILDDEQIELKLRRNAVYGITDQQFLYEILNNNKQYDEQIRTNAFNKITDQDLLYKIVMDEQFRDQFLRTKAFSRITDQDLLIKIVGEHKDWDIRKKAFNRLDADNLEKAVQGKFKDKALSVAAKIILGKTDWSKEFSNKSNGLGSIIGAVALVDSPKPKSEDVVAACHKYIRQGDKSRIPELISLLNDYGNMTLAEDYMNCGQSTLSDAGCDWGRRHGYTCGTGYGSHRVTWGSGR